jgi:hypothetical protein
MCGTEYKQQYLRSNNQRGYQQGDPEQRPLHPLFNRCLPLQALPLDLTILDKTPNLAWGFGQRCGSPTAAESSGGAQKR